LLRFGREDTQRALYPMVYVLTIRGSDLDAAIRAHCSGELSKQIEGADRVAIERMLSKRLQLRSASSLEFATVIDLLNDLPDESALIVVDAASYRPSRPVERSAAGSEQTTAFGEIIHTVVEEDEWSTAIVELAGQLQATVERKHLYVLLLAGEYFPVFEKNQKKLQGVKGAVGGGRPVADVEGEILKQSARWQEMISQRLEDAAFNEIDGLKTSELNRALVKAQCLFADGRGHDGFDLLRPFLDELRRDTSPTLKVNVARMALHAGDHAESLALLDAALEANPTDEPTLRAIHQHARTMRAEPQKARALELLRQRFPRYTYTLGIEIEMCLNRRQYARIVELVDDCDEQADLPEYFRYALVLAKGLGGSVPWPYHSVIDEVAAVASEFTRKAVLHCAGHALANGEIDVALQLLPGHAWDTVEAREVAKVIVRSVEKWALSVPSPQDSVDVREKHDRAVHTIQSALDFVFHYLAEHPEDVYLRVDLTTALACESMGSLGVVILVELLRTAEPTSFREVTEPDSESHDAISGEQYLIFFKKYFEGMDKRNLFLAPEPIRPELQGEPLESVRQKAIAFVKHLASTIDADSTDKNHLLMHLRIALDLTQHFGKVSEIFEIVRMAASARANAGMFQDARDLAETVLLMFGEHRSAAQKQAAWTIFADVYERCGNIAEAILGWLCAAQHRDVELTLLRRGQDMLLHVRLLRDAGMRSEALMHLQRVREFMERSNLDSVMGNRLAHLEATILLGRGSNPDETETEEGENEDLEKLTDLALRPLVWALNSGDDPFPPATLVAQVIAQHGRRGRLAPNAPGPPDRLTVDFCSNL
jgi:tetratricopeptide (TPR) repeat protein